MTNSLCVKYSCSLSTLYIVVCSSSSPTPTLPLSSFLSPGNHWCVLCICGSVFVCSWTRLGSTCPGAVKPVFQALMGRGKRTVFNARCAMWRQVGRTGHSGSEDLASPLLPGKGFKKATLEERVAEAWESMKPIYLASCMEMGREMEVHGMRA